MRKPAQGDAFIGRREELSKVLDPSNHTIVFGYSRWGKTSLLTNIRNSLGSDRCIYISDSGRNSAELSNKIYDAWGGNINSPDAGSFGNKDNLQIMLGNYNHILKEEGRHVYILLDETDRLFADEDSARLLRNLNQQLTNITLSYSMFPHVFADLQKKVSRFQDTTEFVPLVPFNIGETRDLVHICQDSDLMQGLATSAEKDVFDFKGYTVKEDLPEKLLEYTGGFPFLQQGLMRELLQYSAITPEENVLTPKKLDEACDNFKYQVQEQIAHLWNALTPMQKNILVSVSNHPDAPVDYVASAVSAENPSEFFGAINSIGDKGLGVIEGESRFNIRGKLLTNAIGFFGGMFGKK